MYKKRNINKKAISLVTERKDTKRPLNPIDENTTIKLPKTDDNSSKTNKANDDFGNLEDLFSSEENIPASQEPTQRYLSQRSIIAATLTRTQSRNVTYRPPNTYFELIMMKAGVQLDEGDNFVLSCDHVAFVNKFREIFVKSQNYPDNIATFKAGLRDALSAKSKLLQKLLSGCTIDIPGENSVYQSQDSMMINFLMMDILREIVLEVLLDKIEETACHGTMLSADNSVPLFPLMLAQLRYVTFSHCEVIYSRLKDIFEKATESAKWDIITNAEFIFDSTKHDEFAQLILDNKSNTNDFLHTTVIECLTNLCLSAKMQQKLRYKMLSCIKDNQCPNTILPMIVKFLLKVLNDDNDESIRDLVHTMREILIWRTTSAGNVKEQQSQLELFNFIEQGLTRSKKFYNIWQKTISTLPAHQFRSADFLTLLLLMHIKEDNSMYIENILRRRIKLEHITVEILNESKLKYTAVLEQHTNTLMEILHDFMKEKHKFVADFARASYSILFQICESIQKSILKKLLEFICDKSSQNLTNLALELLKNLQRKYPKDVQNWGMLLMPLLDRLNDLSLSQTRLVMELLCSIAFPAPTLAECPVLQDQIDMLVKKQIINCTIFVKKQGIISSVQLIDSIARIEETSVESDDLNTTFSTVSELPDGRGKKAANYIVRVHSSTIHCADTLALFYDELACVCVASPSERTNKGFLDKPFLIWLCELMTYYFQNYFVAEHLPETILGVRLSYQKCLNSIEDINSEGPESELPAIAINISQLVLRPSIEAASSIHVLAPLFNLMRVLHLQRYGGSLELINALLGCAIELPTFFDDSNADSIFYDYEEPVQKQILDIYFHCVNWMRVAVSSFSTQRMDMIRRKVLQRLTDLIKTEDKIRTLLVKAPADYSPPMCQFITISPNAGQSVQKVGVRGKPATGGRSKPKTNHTETESMCLNETNINTNAQDVTSKLAVAGISKCSNAKNNFDNFYGPKELYRQLDSDIMLILNEKMNIKFPLPEEDVGTKIGLLEFRFLLTDLVSKLESVVGVQKFQSEQSLQYIAKPYYFMSDLSKFLGVIIANMKTISVAINEQLEKVKRIYSNADLFTEEFSYLKVCFGLCLRLLAAYFSWSEFSDDTRAQLLKESLLATLDTNKSASLNSKTTTKIASEVFDKFIKYEESIVDLKTAVHLYQLLLTLKHHSNVCEENSAVERQAHNIRTLCKTLLCRKWFHYNGLLERGAICNVYLNELVKGFLKNSDFLRQREILHIVLEECKQLGNKDSSLKSFPNVKKANFPILFRGLCDILISSLNTVITSNNNEFSDKLEVWEKSCKLLNTLLDVVQVSEVSRIFQLFLKHSHLYLKLVLQHGLPVFEEYLRKTPERVSDLIKSLQITTRFLHNLCCHSKALKNTAIITQIPFVRETVEIFVFRIKALMTANKCASVFLMGNLRNKDIHGDEVLSQTASLSPVPGQDSDEEIPEDDLSVDETLIGQEESAENRNVKDNGRSKSSSRSKCF